MQLIYTIQNRPMSLLEHLDELIAYQENVKRQSEIDNRFFQRRLAQASNGKETDDATTSAAQCQATMKRCDEVLEFLLEVKQEELAKQ